MPTESPFSKIPSQLDNIPDEVPVVFISYSWDNEEHIQWVENLSKDLREKYRVYTLLDKYNRGGRSLVEFMKEGLGKADRVLIIGTPKFKEKIDNHQGGANFEDQVISIEIYNNYDSSKFVPVLREGTFPTSFSNLIAINKGYDFSDDTSYEKTLQELAADLWGQPMNTAPILGPKPNFTPAAQILQPLKADNPRDFATIVKSHLLEPSKQILFTELIEDEIETAFSKVMSHASYNHQTTAQTFGLYINWHQEAVANLLSAMLPIVRYGTFEQQKLLVDAMVKLCTKSYRNGETTMVGTNIVHLLASIFLYNATGVAAVKYQRFTLIKLMMETRVPAPHALSLSDFSSLEYLSGISHWNSEYLNCYLQANWIYPFSQMVIASIRPYFEKSFLNEDEFQNCFYVWEHLASLCCNFYKCHYSNKDYYPLGAFLSKQFSMSRDIDDYYTVFFKNATVQKDEWEPLRQGLFNGKYDDFISEATKATEYYKENRRY